MAAYVSISSKVSKFALAGVLPVALTTGIQARDRFNFGPFTTAPETLDTPGSRDRGAARIVCGGKSKTPSVCWYTADHYASFRRITP